MTEREIFYLKCNLVNELVAIEDTTDRMIHIQEEASAVRALLSAMKSQTEHREVTA